MACSTWALRNLETVSTRTYRHVGNSDRQIFSFREIVSWIRVIVTTVLSWLLDVDVHWHVRVVLT